jgi:hypothetical protein
VGTWFRGHLVRCAAYAGRPSTVILQAQLQYSVVAVRTVERRQTRSIIDLRATMDVEAALP